jgi:uncharacterized protein (TIGR00297 family)
VLSRTGTGGEGGFTGMWEKGGCRDAAQVAANGGVATVAALVQIRRPGAVPAAAYFGSLAASCADTWATEIGVRSHAVPRRITDGRPVARGMSGGVTPLGLFASLLGALLLAGIAVTVPDARHGGVGRRRRFVGITLAGIAGSLLDSLLGATVQASRFCPNCRTFSEQRIHRCGTPTRLEHGVRWVDNDVVNALGTLTGASAALLCEALLPR